MSAVLVTISTSPIEAAPHVLVLDVKHRTASRLRQSVKMPKTEFGVMTVLAASRHQASVRDIADHLWGDDDSGGPDTWAESIAVYLTRVRKKIAPLGLKVKNWPNSGWQLLEAA